VAAGKGAKLPLVATRQPVDGLSLVVAQNARMYRARRRESQEVVAGRAGISRASLGVIEGERQWVTIDMLLRLCRGLDVTLPELLAGAPSDALRDLGL
jgi:transcriptional regulator with XRE-family HTH domain